LRILPTHFRTWSSLIGLLRCLLLGSTIEECFVGGRDLTLDVDIY
jgi:hypothetical protein